MADQPRFGTPDFDYIMQLAGTAAEDDGPIWMVNLMKYREVANYADGRDSTISGREADDIYSPIDVLTDIGAEVVFIAEVDQQLLGDDPVWDRIGIVKYPSRGAFIAMQARSDFQELHVHKEAGMERTIVCGSLPMELPTAATVDWSQVPHPPTDDDGAVVVMHVLRFKDDAAPAATPEDMTAYQEAAGQVAAPHGVRINGWFGVEGTVVGDGRSWHQIRFNEFPSKAAFMAVVTDPARLEAQKDHREVAIADNYTMILRAELNRLAESIES